MTQPTPDELLDRAFAALADRTRRDLVARLSVGDASVTELAAPYGMTLQAVSKHLKVLEAAGLVTKRADAQRRLVHLEAGRLAPMLTWIDQHQRRAEERFRRLDAVLDGLNETHARRTAHQPSPEGHRP